MRQTPPNGPTIASGSAHAFDRIDAPGDRSDQAFPGFYKIETT